MYLRLYVLRDAVFPVPYPILHLLQNVVQKITEDINAASMNTILSFATSSYVYVLGFG